MSLVPQEQQREALRFFFEPVQGYAAAAFRIVFGSIALWTALFTFPNLKRYYSDEGMIPYRLVDQFPEQAYSILEFAPKDFEFLHSVTMAFVVASACLLLGIGARFSALCILIIQVALQHRDPYIANGGDRLFSILAGLSVFLPLSRKWSVRSFIESRFRVAPSDPKYRSPRFPLIWGQRLICLQIAYVYLYAFGAKIGQPHWIDGSALGAVLASPRLAEWPYELTFYPLVALMSWGTLLFELSFPLFVWRDEYRVKLLLIGCLFHVGIDLLLMIPMFTPIMVCSYLLFLKDDEVKAAARFLSFGLIRR